MNARELLDEDKWGLETHLDTAYSEDICQTILSALRLLAAAEANDGTTPETDALIKSQGLTLTPYEAAHYALAENCQMIERERNGLAARVRELEKDAERLDWMDKNAFTAYRERDLEHGELYDNATVVNEDRRGSRTGEVYKTIRESIDAARGSKP